jgi:TonB family protein
MRQILMAAALMGAGFLLAVPASAQSQETLRADLQAALTGKDLDTALDLAGRLYDTALAEQDKAGAGAAAYSRAEILTARNAHEDAAKSYEQCEDQYREVGAAAQSLQCALRAATSLQSAGKPGNGLDKLQAVARELESIGQDRSGFAVGVYMALAQATLPPKFHRLDGARGKREKTIAYTDKAMQALDAIGQAESEHYASALMLKGEAQEDLHEYAAAAATYESFLKLYPTLPNASDEVYDTALNRYRIARSELDDGDADTVTVAGKDGEEIVLTIERKRKVRTPRAGKETRLADGASVEALITLQADGHVKDIEILSSVPNEDYGEAFRKGVSQWRFTPPEGMTGEDVPPFEYGMVFYVTRRN